VPSRVSPTDVIRAEIHDLFGSGRDIAEVLEEVMRLSARLVLQQVLEDEVTAWLGRSWNSRTDGERDGQRNGYGGLRVKTTAGPLDLKRPKLRNTTEKFASTLFGAGVVRSEPLEALVISAWVRGLSDRDIEAHLAEALGPEAALSKSTVSRICQRLRGEFDVFRERDLSDIDLDYLFLDGSHFKMHDGSRAEPVLVAYGITTVGAPVLLAVEPGGDESHDAWADFLDGLRTRGLRVPLLVISDGAAGLIGAIDTKMSSALRQRCLIHRCRNVIAKVPAEHRDGVKKAFWELFDVDFDQDNIEPGDTAVRLVQGRIDAFARRWEREFPAAVKCLLTDRQALTAYLRFPVEHHKRIRHTNLIERTFGETRRRVKVIGRLPGEASCLSLVWAVLDRASRGWRGLTYTPAIARHLTELRHQLHHPSQPAHERSDEAVTAAA
jgi:transposase-like protein